MQRKGRVFPASLGLPHPGLMSLCLKFAQCPLGLKIVQPGDGGESAGEVKVSGPERRHSTWSRMPAASWTSSSAQERGRHHFPEPLDQNQLSLEP